MSKDHDHVIAAAHKMAARMGGKFVPYEQTTNPSPPSEGLVTQARKVAAKFFGDENWDDNGAAHSVAVQIALAALQSRTDTPSHDAG